MDDNHNIEYNKKRVDKEYFIDRRGKTHKFNGDLCKQYNSFHYEIAHKLYPNARNPDDILMNLGWVLVGSTVYHQPIIHKEPSQAQINKLDELGIYEHLGILHDGYYVKY